MWPARRDMRWLIVVWWTTGKRERDRSREDLILLLEEETVPSRFNPERLLGYTVRVMRREGTRRVIPIVISLKRGTMEVEMAVGGDYVQPLPFRVPHCHLAMLDALDHAHSPNIAVRILTVMMGYPNTPEARVRVFGQAWQGRWHWNRTPTSCSSIWASSRPI